MRQLLSILIGALGASVTMSLLFAAWRGESVLGFIAAAVVGLMTLWLYDRTASGEAPALRFDDGDARAPASHVHRHG